MITTEITQREQAIQNINEAFKEIVDQKLYALSLLALLATATDCASACGWSIKHYVATYLAGAYSRFIKDNLVQGCMVEGKFVTRELERDDYYETRGVDEATFTGAITDPQYALWCWRELCPVEHLPIFYSNEDTTPKGMTRQFLGFPFELDPGTHLCKDNVRAALNLQRV